MKTKKVLRLKLCLRTTIILSSLNIKALRCLCCQIVDGQIVCINSQTTIPTITLVFNWKEEVSLDSEMLLLLQLCYDYNINRVRAYNKTGF